MNKAPMGDMMSRIFHQPRGGAPMHQQMQGGMQQPMQQPMQGGQPGFMNAALGQFMGQMMGGQQPQRQRQSAGSPMNAIIAQLMQRGR